jgi:hypothetical protein
METNNHPDVTDIGKVPKSQEKKKDGIRGDALEIDRNKKTSLEGRWKSGWDGRSRTLTYRSRVCCPTIRRHPNS